VQIGLQCGEQRRRVALERDQAGAIQTIPWQGGVVAFVAGDAWRFEPSRAVGEDAATAEADGAVRSPIPGLVAAIPVEPGQAVVRGQTLVVVEAMKTEHSLAAPFDGVVQAVRAAVGEQVDEGAVVAVVTKGEG
jgi:propionyl-CoA carboxylase alpha chain/3-methylcrotonyl-CoA carboxylase alpha subunit